VQPVCGASGALGECGLGGAARVQLQSAPAALPDFTGAHYAPRPVPAQPADVVLTPERRLEHGVPVLDALVHGHFLSLQVLRLHRAGQHVPPGLLPCPARVTQT